MGFVAACMAACLAAGMGLAVGLERTMTPPSLSDSSDARNLALGSEEFDDVRSLNVDVTAWCVRAHASTTWMARLW